MRFDIHGMSMGKQMYFKVPFSGILIWFTIILVALMAIGESKDVFGYLYEHTMECIEYETMDGRVEDECSTKSVMYRKRFPSAD